MLTFPSSFKHQVPAVCHRMHFLCPFCWAVSTLFLSQEELHLLTEMQDTAGSPFIHMQNQVHRILIRCPQQSNQYSETTFFSLEKAYLGIFKLLKELLHPCWYSESFLPLFFVGPLNQRGLSARLNLKKPFSNKRPTFAKVKNTLV